MNGTFQPISGGSCGSHCGCPGSPSNWTWPWCRVQCIVLQSIAGFARPQPGRCGWDQLHGYSEEVRMGDTEGEGQMVVEQHFYMFDHLMFIFIYFVNPHPKIFFPSPDWCWVWYLQPRYLPSTGNWTQHSLLGWLTLSPLRTPARAWPLNV